MARTTGQRIRYWRMRRNGMTQRVLGDLAGVSQAYISQVESGRATIDKRSTLVNIARALKVTVADLLDQPGDPTDPAKADAAAAVPAIWAALIEIEEGERRTPQCGVDQLRLAIARADELRAAQECAAMAALLPGLLFDAAGHGDDLLAQVGYQTSSCLRSLGYRHLALPAARIAVRAAEAAGDPAWVGASRFAYTLALPVEAAGVASRTANRALVELQARASLPSVRQMLGQLHLSAAFLSTIDGREAEARSHLAEAAAEADNLGDPLDGLGFNRSCFGPTNVGIWRMSIASERSEYGKVIELAQAVRPDPLKHANRHQSYWLTLGHALAQSRRDAEAILAFLRAERAAPAAFALNPLAHDAVAAMVARARRHSAPENLRTLARRLSIDV